MSGVLCECTCRHRLLKSTLVRLIRFLSVTEAWAWETEAYENFSFFKRSDGPRLWIWSAWFAKPASCYDNKKFAENNAIESVQKKS